MQLALRRSFITPFDRGDIHGLINDLDDAIDQMRQTVKAISLFDVADFDPGMKKIGDLIVESARISRETLPLLRAMNANAAADQRRRRRRSSQLEEESDHLYHAGPEGPLSQPTRKASRWTISSGSEIYSHLEKVVDCFEDVADRMSGILLEHL